MALGMVALYTLSVVPDWTIGSARWALVMAAALVGLFSPYLSGFLAGRAARITRLLPLVCLIMVAGLLIEQQGGMGAALVYALLLACTVALIWGVQTREQGLNLAVMTGSVAVSLLLVNAISPTLTQTVANMQKQKALQQAGIDLRPPLDETQMTPATSTTIADVAPQAEIIYQNGSGPAWGPLAGWGTNTNTRLHYWMTGAYDVMVDYNAEGYRGPVMPYDKPADVYRILFIGDSYIEAREVDYEKTIYAQLGDLLKNAHTADGKRIEVMGVGATGWGTLQAYLYYHNEGYKYHPDLVINPFIINDVADNNPTVFYPDRTIDFAISDASVQIVAPGTLTPRPTYNGMARWLENLPPMMQPLGLMQLMRQVFTPPREVLATASGPKKAHPQRYIFVSYPEIKGYAEGWSRTEAAYALLNREIKAQGGRLMVVYVDIGADRITEMTQDRVEDQTGWLWDLTLPVKHLQSFLPRMGIPLLLTGDTYKECAAQAKERVYDLLFYVGDGHWNPLGHRITAGLVAQTLYDDGTLDPAARPSHEALLGCFATG